VGDGCFGSAGRDSPGKREESGGSSVGIPDNEKRGGKGGLREKGDKEKGSGGRCMRKKLWGHRCVGTETSLSSMRNSKDPPEGGQNELKKKGGPN